MLILSNLSLIVVQRHTAASSSTSPCNNGQHLFTTGSPITTCTNPPRRSTQAPSLSVSTGQLLRGGGGGGVGVVGVGVGVGGVGQLPTGGGLPVTGGNTGGITGGPMIGGRDMGGRPMTGGLVMGGLPIMGGRIMGGLGFLGCFGCFG